MNVVDPFFLLSITNPWTGVAKVATIIPEGIDGEWVLNIQSVAEAYEDLAAGEIYFVPGTWNCAIYLNEVSSSALIRTIQLQA